MNITALIYGRGGGRAAPRIAPKDLVDEVQQRLRDRQVVIQIFEHKPVDHQSFREVQVSALDRPDLPLLRIIDGHCTVDEIGFGPADNTQTLRLLRDAINDISQNKAANILDELERNCRSVKNIYYGEMPSLQTTVLNKGASLSIAGQSASPRLGVREDLPLLLLDNDHAARIGVKGLKGLYLAKRNRFIISDDTFFIIGQGDSSTIKSIEISIRKPSLRISGLIQDAWGEPLISLKKCFGETASSIGFHLKEICRSQLLTVSSKLIFS